MGNRKGEQGHLASGKRPPDASCLMSPSGSLVCREKGRADASGRGRRDGPSGAVATGRWSVERRRTAAVQRTDDLLVDPGVGQETAVGDAAVTDEAGATVETR